MVFNEIQSMQQQDSIKKDRNYEQLSELKMLSSVLRNIKWQKNIFPAYNEKIYEGRVEPTPKQKSKYGFLLN